MKINNTIVRYAILLMLVFALSGCSASEQEIEETNTYEEEQQEPQTETISFNAVVSGNTDRNIICLSNGVVKELYVKVGDTVEMGDKICKINDESLQSELETLQQKLAYEKKVETLTITKYKENIAKLDKIRTQKLKEIKNQIEDLRGEYNLVSEQYKKYLNKYNTAHANTVYYKGRYEEEVTDKSLSLYQNSKAEEEQYEELYKSSQESMNSLQDKIAELDDSYKLAELEQNSIVREEEYNLKVYKNENVAEYEKQIKELKRNMKGTLVTAEENGIITALMVEKGQNFEGGKVASYANGDGYIVRGYLQQSAIFKVNEGMKVTLKPDYEGSETITGRISKIVEVYDDENLGFPIEIAISKKSKVKIGMDAKVKIEVEIKKD